jgi:hypothetical protein
MAAIRTTGATVLLNGPIFVIGHRFLILALAGDPFVAAQITIERLD